MLSANFERSLGRILGYGATTVSLFLLWGVVNDPVNATKHFLLGAFGISSLLISTQWSFRSLWQDSKLILIPSLLFVLFSLSAVLNSQSPVSQNLYGTFGRNTGFMAYLFLVAILIAALALRSSRSFEVLLQGLIIAGIVNVIYCFWAWQVGDFIGWSNPYNTILGTFGNPNFIGAFLGIFVSVLFAFMVSPGRSLTLRLVCTLPLLIALLEIKQSHAIQGIVVAAGGFALVTFFLIRDKFKSAIPLAIYSLSVVIVGIFAILGALQKGPLTQYIYKTSVSLRGEYWQAGTVMGNKFPFTGVGMDSYGDWYRRSRDASAMILPGPNVVTNAAHNVNIDLLAFGGWPLFIIYIFILVMAALSIFKVIIRQKDFNWVFVGLSVAWICYQVQALISINQIGLAIWGWLLTGAVIAYEISTRPANSQNSNQGGKSSAQKLRKSGYSGTNISPQLVAGIGLVIGGLLGVPPLSADMKWRSALESGNVTLVESALIPSYLNPANSAKYAQAVQLFESNKLPDLAYKYANISVKFNPDSFDAWKLLYYISKSTEVDKNLALTNMKRLDPLNNKILDR